jgi:hypothetical protein
MATITINDKILEDAKKVSDIKNMNEIIEESLRIFIDLNKQKKIRLFRGKLQWSGDLSTMREQRFDIS